jgi:uncharacterized protein DUF4007
MLRGPLARPGFKGQFAGHETFPLRHLWLRKAYDAVKGGAPRGTFTDPDAIITFGVGKNMVSSIRHWALACNVIEDKEGCFHPTSLGEFLFGEEGRDPFMESPATTWLIHWLIAGAPERTTTWFYAFSHFTGQTFDREILVKPIQSLCEERQWARTSAATIKRDVECFIRSYVPRADARFSDDTMEPVLAELGLIRTVGTKSFEFRRGPKPTLPDGIFLYALHEFWQRSAFGQNTLAVESLAYEPGSPGSVFKLDEHSLIERLARVEESSGKRFLWSDTAGVRNVARNRILINPLELLELAYEKAERRRAA